jgi:hypothetical protein
MTVLHHGSARADCAIRNVVFRFDVVPWGDVAPWQVAVFLILVV